MAHHIPASRSLQVCTEVCSNDKPKFMRLMSKKSGEWHLAFLFVCRTGIPASNVIVKTHSSGFLYPVTNLPYTHTEVRVSHSKPKLKSIAFPTQRNKIILLLTNL